MQLFCYLTLIAVLYLWIYLFFSDWKIYFASYSGLAQEEAQSKASQMDF